MLASIPLPARLLGLAGLVPFWACAIAVVFGDDELASSALYAQVAYGALILTFLGGVHWGIALRSGTAPSWGRLGWGVTPSLVGWAALLMPPAQGLGLLAAGLAIALAVDLETLKEPTAPGWYAKLRRFLTTGALASLLVALFGR